MGRVAIAGALGAALLVASVGCDSGVSAGGGPADGAAMSPDVTATIFGGDSDAGAGCIDIQASNYDLSCTSDTDCTIVGGFGNACIVCLNCAGAAINKASEGRYWIDQRKATAGQVPCVCPTYPKSCCVRGMCTVGSVCANRAAADDADADTDAAADADADATMDRGAADAGAE